MPTQQTPDGLEVRSFQEVLAPLFEGHCGGNFVAFAQHLHFDNISNLVRTQGMREIVEVLHWAAAELDQNVARFDARLVGRRAWLDVGELDSGFHRAEIRYRPEPRPVAAARTAYVAAVGGAFDLNEFRALFNLD